MNRLAAAAAAGFAVILTVILALLCAGCTGSFGPTNPTNPPYSIEDDVTLPTGPGLGMFQFEVGLPAGDPLQAWTRVADHLDFDPAVGLMFRSYLEYLPSGVIRHFSVQATTGDDREVLVNWPGHPGGGTIASIESAPPGFMGGGRPMAYTVHSVLSALAAVGHDSLLAMLPAPGETGYYSLQLPVDVGYLQANHLLAEAPTYVWDGVSFQPADPVDARYAQEDRFLCVQGTSMGFLPEDQRPAPDPHLMAAITTSAYGSIGFSYYLIPLEQDAERAQDYFARAGYLQGITLRDIQLGDDVQGRTLSLTFAGDGSEQAAELFSNLYYGSTSDDGWPTQLNKAGLGIAHVRMAFDWGDGTPPEALEVDVARHSVAGSTRIRSGPPTTAPTPNGVTQQLRIVNVGTVDIHGLVVRFPEGTVDFGDVPAGATTEYRDAVGGVYRYSAYGYTLDGKPALQRVADWVGESPMPGTAFTYRIQFYPAHRDGAQIVLIGVTVDRQ